MFKSSSPSTAEPADEDSIAPVHNVYLPYRAGLPPMRAYLRELWKRRTFIAEMSRATIRANNLDTWFGRIWNILNPLLLGLTFYLLVQILKVKGGDYPYFFANLMAGLFLFTFYFDAVTKGTRSVVSSGKMVLNLPFPRVMLPVASVRSALAMFWPTVVVLVVIVYGTGVRPGIAVVATIPVLIITIMLALGSAMLLATVQVYFRDAKSFVSHFGRLLMYGSGILFPGELLLPTYWWYQIVNPMYSLILAWDGAIIRNQWPTPIQLLSPLCWAIALILIGGYLFISRERDFAVRI